MPILKAGTRVIARSARTHTKRVVFYGLARRYAQRSAAWEWVVALHRPPRLVEVGLAGWCGVRLWLFLESVYVGVGVAGMSCVVQLENFCAVRVSHAFGLDDLKAVVVGLVWVGRRRLCGMMRVGCGFEGGRFDDAPRRRS